MRDAITSEKIDLPEHCSSLAIIMAVLAASRYCFRAMYRRNRYLASLMKSYKSINTDQIPAAVFPFLTCSSHHHILQRKQTSLLHEEPFARTRFSYATVTRRVLAVAQAQNSHAEGPQGRLAGAGQTLSGGMQKATDHYARGELYRGKPSNCSCVGIYGVRKERRDSF